MPPSTSTALLHHDREAEFASEVTAYVEHLNNLLVDAKDLAGRYLPLEGLDLFEKCKDGVLLTKSLNAIKAGLVAENKLAYNINLAQVNEPGSKAIFEVTANQNLFLENVGKLGCKIVNVGAQDIIDGKQDLILGIVWQMIRAHLLSEVDVLHHPELIRLMQPGESLKTLIDLGPEQVLLRWFNYHLAKAGSQRRVGNFSESIKDSENYLRLMQQIAPRLVSESAVEAALASSDPAVRAKAVLDIAETLKCRKFVRANDIVNGYSRLNLGFTATLFNTHIGIRLPSEDEIAAMYNKFEDMKEEIQKLHDQLKAKQAELEAKAESSAQEVHTLKVEKSAVDDKLNAEIQRAVGLERQLSEIQRQHENAVREATENALKSNESTATLIAAHKDEVAKLNQQIEALRSQDAVVSSLIASVSTVLPTTVTAEIAGKVGSHKEGEKLSHDLRHLQSLVESLLAELAASRATNEKLETHIARQKEMNNLMTTKVVEIAEELNKKEKVPDKKKS